MFGINPKEIILNQLQKRFEEAGFKKVMFTYCESTGDTTAKGLTTEGKTEPLLVEKSENTLIRSTLIKQVKKGLNFEFTHLIAELDIESKAINIYARDKENNLTPLTV